MELAQLRYFLKIVEHRNFTKAAKACSVSQPALSQQIAKLEKELGLPLFERNGRKIRLTNTGKILRENAEKILRLVEDTYRQIADDGKSGVVKLGTTPTVGPFLTTKLIHNLAKQFPGSQIQLSEKSADAVVEQVKSGEVDFAISTLPNAENKSALAGLNFEPLMQEEVQVVLSAKHELATKNSLTVEDLKSQPMILLGKRQHFTQIVESFLYEFGLWSEPVARVEQFSTLQHLVAIGRGISFVPRMAVNPKFKENLSYKEIAGYSLSRTVGLCWNESRYKSQLIENMIKAILEFADPDLNTQKAPIKKPKKKNNHETV